MKAAASVYTMPAGASWQSRRGTRNMHAGNRKMSSSVSRIMEHCLSILSCPLCQTSLTHTGKTLQCLRAHSFDLAREGYVNFLLKRSPGDTKEMLLARRTFLERGHYNPLAVRINQFVSTYLSEKGRLEETFILDAGCGE